MARTKGSMKLGQNIEPQIGAPLDARLLVKTKADLTNPKSYEYAYVGMKVMVKDELKEYILKAKDTTVEENWEPVSGGNIDPEQLEGLATKEELEDYVKREELENYATKEELDDVGGSTPKAIPIPIVDTEASQFTYDGTPKKLVFTNVNEKDVVIIDDIKTDAGTYICKVYPKGLNVWIGDRDYKTYEYEWTIGKAESEVTFDKESITLNNSNLSDTFNYATTGDGVVTVTSSDITVATVDGNINPVTVTNVNEKNGSIYITVSVAEGNNYLSSSATIVVNAEFIHVVTWANGSDEEINEMLTSAYNGDFDYDSNNPNSGGLYDYWAIGDERIQKVTINNNEEYVTLVLEETGDNLATNINYNDSYKLEDQNNNMGRKYPWFIIGTKNLLSTGINNNKKLGNDGLDKSDQLTYYGREHWYYYGAYSGFSVGIFDKDFRSIIRKIKYPVCYANIYSGYGFGETSDSPYMGTEYFQIKTQSVLMTRHAAGEILSSSIMEEKCADKTLNKMFILEKKMNQFTYYKNFENRRYKKNSGGNANTTSTEANPYITRSLGLVSLSSFDTSNYNPKPTHDYAAAGIGKSTGIIEFYRYTSCNADFIFAI